YTVTDTGFPAGNTGNKLTSAPATITITTPDNSSSIAWIGGTQGNDTIQVSKTTTNLVVTINGTVVSNTVPLASVTEVRPFGLAGTDTLFLNNLSKTAAFDGGSGTDTLRIDGSNANDTF